MTTCRAFTSAASALIASTVVWSAAVESSMQPHPDFSGTWTVAQATPASSPTGGAQAASVRGDMGSGWGSTIAITQDAKQLTVEYALYTRYDLQPPVKLLYALDGSETRNTVMMGRGVQVQSSRTAWEGQTLRITTLFTFADPVSGKAMPVELNHRLSLESPTSLVVEVERPAVLGGPPSATRTLYKKG